MLKDSRIAGLYKLTVGERIDALCEHGCLSSAQAAKLRDGDHVLSCGTADRMIENVIGVFGLPFAIAPNFVVNGLDRMVPLVVEEPSIVAALSGAARLARSSGGFKASCEESLLAGQVHITGVENPAAAIDVLEANRRALLELADDVHPRLRARGGGVRDLQAALLELPDGAPLIRVHLLVDTADAMGANLVNTICETVAPKIAGLCKGNVAMRILSNLADRSIIKASVRYDTAALATDGFTGASVRDGIIMAGDIAAVDPYRAATHNKGIMNGIDALAIATGNDWRAIEAGAHAYAAASGRYMPLTRWASDSRGDLVGEIAIPLKVGTVGGTLTANPAAALGLAMTGGKTATDLAMLMASVGLAQNFAALRALASSGIQQGHMRLHARAVVAALAPADDRFDELVDRLVDSGEIKRWKAAEILEQMGSAKSPGKMPAAAAAGKVILFGEHAVVYGRHALALPIPDAVHATAVSARAETTLVIPDWGVQEKIDLAHAEGIGAAVALILAELEIVGRNFALSVESRLPKAMGLGSSAAVAVAITRALCELENIVADDERVNAIAFACEKLAHGTPSGVDNTLSTFARPMLFRNDGSLRAETITLAETPPIVIACSHQAGLTSVEVAGVKARYVRAPSRYEALFDEIDRISLAGAELLKTQDYAQLGLAMNVCHGLLNALGVSTPELERMVAMARRAGAAGAKLTGGGGGGSIIALCPGTIGSVQGALQDAGYRTLVLQ